MIDPKEVIKEIIGRGVEWFDYKSKGQNLWQSYFAEANQIVNSEVFNNEIQHYITDLMKFMSYEANSFDQILHTRTAIIVLESLKERLKSIENPHKEMLPTDPHEAI